MQGASKKAGGLAAVGRSVAHPHEAAGGRLLTARQPGPRLRGLQGAGAAGVGVHASRQASFNLAGLLAAQLS